MPHGMILLIVGLILFTWFLLGERTSFIEKLVILGICFFIYVFYKFLNGVSYQEIVNSFKNLIGG